MSTSPSVTVVLPAAGTGSRFGQNTNKLFELFDDQPLWRHAVERFACRQDVRRVILAVSEQDRSMFAQQLDRQPTSCPVIMVRGGARRTDSVRQALASIVEGDVTDLVAIHDAARPLVRQRELDAVFAKAMQCGAAILAAPVSGTLKRVAGEGSQTVSRRDMFTALTPQVFSLELIRQAYAHDRGRAATDDAELVERLGRDVSVVPGSADNLKITYPEDLRLAEALLHECRSEFA